MSNWTDHVESSIAIDLDQGESTGTLLALSHPASLLLMDERHVRSVARQHRIAVAGIAAVIGQARMRHLIPSARGVRTVIAERFRIAPQVIRTMLRWVSVD